MTVVPVTLVPVTLVPVTLVPVTLVPVTLVPVAFTSVVSGVLVCSGGGGAMVVSALIRSRSGSPSADDDQDGSDNPRCSQRRDAHHDCPLRLDTFEVNRAPGGSRDKMVWKA